MSLPVTCPLCRSPLRRDTVTWRCPEGHTFDVAREGYVNLLPVQHRKSRAPGDNADMVRARRAFLDAGHYAPLRDAIATLVAPLHARRVIDIGCGEGYYTGALRADSFGGQAEGSGSGAGGGEILGVDISRDAVQRAAKRYPDITWLVAGSAALPLADHCCDLAASLFAPVPAAEIARVLQPGGHLLIATPASDHLWSLRDALFETVRPHEPEKQLSALADDFELQDSREVRFDLMLESAALGQLLLMTPYGWRATRERREALVTREQLPCTAAFTLYLLKKREEQR